MHLPVLSQEVIHLLDLHEGETAVDGTFGGGGHAREILKKIGARGTLIGIDWDAQTLEKTKSGFPKNCRIVHGNYKDTGEILKKLGIGQADALLLDLGFSSFQIEDGSRGFGFQTSGPLDMRYDTSSGVPASAILNSLPQKELADIIYEYGEESRSRGIAKTIAEERKKGRIETTDRLRDIIRFSVYPHSKEDRLLPYAVKKNLIGIEARVFQAFRIYINDEFGNLKMFLARLPSFLAPKGRCAIISFHSLEDRIVKQAFRDLAKNSGWKDLSKKPVIPTEEEIRQNPRSRSAKLRAIEKI